MADETLPEWAIQKACRLFNAMSHNRPWDPALNRSNPVVVVFAQYNAEHEEEPVDPLVYEARRLVIQDGTTRTVNQIEAIRDGHAGKDKVNLALAALKRGMELARPTLTREMVGEAVFAGLHNPHIRVDADAVFQNLRAALTWETPDA